jgi:hypothetical protein
MAPRDPDGGLIEVDPDQVDTAAGTFLHTGKFLRDAGGAVGGAGLPPVGDEHVDGLLRAFRDEVGKATATFGGEVDRHGKELANAAWMYRAMDHLP